MPRFAASLLILLTLTAGLNASEVSSTGVVATNAPRTTNNDDSCDVGNYPAATLLLPYFEVDFQSPVATARTTLVTLVNTSPQPQIVRTTIWTDWGAPVLGFNLFLTGYDVQAISLYDIIARGMIPMTNSRLVEGSQSLPNVGGNPNHSLSASTACADLPTQVPASILANLQYTLTTGRSMLSGGQVGGVHSNAKGYATFDVVATCSPKMPNEFDFYRELLFDNVLTGDFALANPNPATGNYLSGSPLVHIRAIPEGGAAGTVVATNLPYTFYDRFTGAQPVRTFDRRQPLPFRFATRWTSGGRDAFEGSFLVWREGKTSGTSTSYSQNGALPVTEVIRFDSSENPAVAAPCMIAPCPPPPATPLTEMINMMSSPYIPPDFSGDIDGWIYFNLWNQGSTAYSPVRQTRPASQNWMVMQTTWEGRYSTSADVAQLGNGCSTDVGAAAPIAPSPNAGTAQRFDTGSPATIGNDDSCDLALAPAATLLLPHFAVTTNVPATAATDVTFSITNVTQNPQIAHVTIWSDRSYPLYAFNVHLTGYDYQRLRLSDVLLRGILPTATRYPGPLSVRTNSSLDADAEASCAGAIPEVPFGLLERLRNVLEFGMDGLGNVHEGLLKGYLTIDVVDRCTANLPNDPNYYLNDVLYDNVLIGDYTLANSNPTTGNYALSSPMVHIRAFPEGGKGLVATNLPFTFYDRYTPSGMRKIDRRQPLPGTFAATWLDTTSATTTSYLLWREGVDKADENRSGNVSANASIPAREVVRFDESENPSVYACASPCPGFASPASSISATADLTIFPPLFSGGDIAGWMYLNLNNANPRAYSEPRSTGSLQNRSQNWVEVARVRPGLWADLKPATQLSNGCSVAPVAGATIAPGTDVTPAVLPCPAITSCTATVPPTAPEESFVTFTGDGVAPANLDCGLGFEWDFGDGSPSTFGAPTTTHRFTAEGTFTWSVKARQTDGISLADGSICVHSGTIVITSTPFDPIPGPGAAGSPGSLDAADVIAMINYLLGGGPLPPGEADADGDDQVTIKDLFWAINAVFAGG